MFQPRWYWLYKIVEIEEIGPVALVMSPSRYEILIMHAASLQGSHVTKRDGCGRRSWMLYCKIDLPQNAVLSARGLCSMTNRHTGPRIGTSDADNGLRTLPWFPHKHKKCKSKIWWEVSLEEVAFSPTISSTLIITWWEERNVQSDYPLSGLRSKPGALWIWKKCIIWPVGRLSISQ